MANMQELQQQLQLSHEQVRLLNVEVGNINGKLNFLDGDRLNTGALLKAANAQIQNSNMAKNAADPRSRGNDHRQPVGIDASES